MKKTEENSEDLYACFNNTSLIFVERFHTFSKWLIIKSSKQNFSESRTKS